MLNKDRVALLIAFLRDSADTLDELPAPTVVRPSGGGAVIKGNVTNSGGVNVYGGSHGTINHYGATFGPDAHVDLGGSGNAYGGANVTVNNGVAAAVTTRESLVAAAIERLGRQEGLLGIMAGNADAEANAVLTAIGTIKRFASEANYSPIAELLRLIADLFERIITRK